MTGAPAGTGTLTWGRARSGLLAAVLLAGCAPWQTPAPVTPVSYQHSHEGVPRSVGKLRRLAVLQVAESAPRACHTGPGVGTDSERRLEPVDRAVRDHLVERKGYEVVDLDPQRHAAWLGEPASPAWLAELVRAFDPVQRPGPALRTWLAQLGTDERVDGLLVLWVRLTCANAFNPGRSLLAIGSLGISELLPDPRLREIDIVHHGAVFETSRGVLVWRHDHQLQHRLASSLASALRADAAARDALTPIEQLVDALEPAVPRLLTR